MAPIVRRAMSERLDDLLRFLDLHAHRTVGGWIHARFSIDRHSIAAVLLPMILCGLLVLGSPTWARSLLALCAAILTGIAVVWEMRATTRRRWPIVIDFASQAAIVLTISAIAWFGTPHIYQEASLYTHAFIPLSVAVSVALGVGAMLVGPTFKWAVSVSKYGDYLKCTELFASRGAKAPPSIGRVVTGFIAVVSRAPLALLVLPAIATLLVPPVWIPAVPIAAGLLCVVALGTAALNERFAIMWLLFQQVLFNGGAFVVSLLVVILAALRLWEVTYVTTLFDSAAWWTIAVLIATAYVLSWWFDYWLERMLTDELLRLLDPHARGVASVSYEITSDAARTTVPASNRLLQVHGAGRFLVLSSAGKISYFQAYRPMQLIELLAASGAPGGKATPTPNQLAARIANYQVLTTSVLVAIVAIAGWHLHRGEQLPQVRLQQTSGGVSLHALLMKAAPAGSDDRVIVFAASGGGTRAAVFAAAALEGIAAQGKADRILLGSGVSGGGAALAYFAGKRRELIANSPKAWDDYFDTMTKPFIQDVLERSTEWRMMSSGRLGMLLSESFRRRWNLPEDRNKLAQISDMGLILNTSLAGQFKRPLDAPRKEPLYVNEPTYREQGTTSTLAGGRLLLTNLVFQESLVRPPLEPDVGGEKLPVLIRSADLRLEDAAALNANFPPVFSNAAIDVDEQARYWVTDGGAIDNRGIETLLYAVRLELKNVSSADLPRLHIIVADASAFSTAYSQDRGLSTVTGGGSRYASHLNAELLDAIRERYKDNPERFEFSYIMMPGILRESGSFGTHWMLQDRIKVRNGTDRVTISGQEMVKVIRALHTGDDKALHPDGCKVYLRSREDGTHRDRWSSVLNALGGSIPAPSCNTKR